MRFCIAGAASTINSQWNLKLRRILNIYWYWLQQLMPMESSWESLERRESHRSASRRSARAFLSSRFHSWALLLTLAYSSVRVRLMCELKWDANATNMRAASDWLQQVIGEQFAEENACRHKSELSAGINEYCSRVYEMRCDIRFPPAALCLYFTR